MKFTIVYVDDDHQPTCYGTFATREAAAKHAERMDRDLDEDRDRAGGGVGNVSVCAIRPLRTW